ncbi:MAG: dihydrodipicolinate synthase family protein [Verrucomicrobiales bacterium]
MSTASFRGLIPAVFTPLDPQGELNLELVPKIVDHLCDQGVRAIFALGSSGEGPSLTISERKAVAEAYITAARGKVRVILHVGHNCVREAAGLASHGAEFGADVISAVSPSYFRPQSVQDLGRSLSDIASAAPDTPFFFYHLPGVTGVDFDVVEMTEHLAERIPTLKGIKFSKPDLAEFRTCLDHLPQHVDVLWGCDEMFLSALAAGAQGAVGTTFNYMAPLFHKIMERFETGDLAEAQELQGIAVEIIRLVIKHCGRGGLKALSKFLDLDCGPHRPPLADPPAAKLVVLHEALERIGYFNWAPVALRKNQPVLER